MFFVILFNNAHEGYPLKVPDWYEKCFRISNEGKSLSTPPSGKEWATSKTTNVEEERVNSGIRFLPLPSANGLLGARMRG